ARIKLSVEKQHHHQTQSPTAEKEMPLTGETDIFGPPKGPSQNHCQRNHQPTNPTKEEDQSTGHNKLIRRL
ncbi:hypothetical protein AB0N29_15505, partial [Nocardioides sp. NPDC092400]|uniref:hypothetical protein n=1 Tax=Nocardioides sp. NPDC092400 TaxID=3155196 RepID=UPI00343E3483